MGKDLKGKELGSGIYQRKNGSYCARYVDRYGVRKSIYDKDLRELNRKLKLNKIAARWPAKAVAQFSTFSKKGSDRIVPR